MGMRVSLPRGGSVRGDDCRVDSSSAPFPRPMDRLPSALHRARREVLSIEEALAFTEATSSFG